MSYVLVYWPTADEALDRLDDDPAMAQVRWAVARVERRLEADPFTPRLGTISFVTEELGGICATPAGLDDWCVIWQRGEGPGVIEIIQVHRLHLRTQPA